MVPNGGSDGGQGLSISNRDRLVDRTPLGHELIYCAQLAVRVRRVPRLEVLEPGAVRLFGERLERVAHPHQLVAPLEHVTGCVARAAIGMEPRDVDLAMPRSLSTRSNSGLRNGL